MGCTSCSSAGVQLIELSQKSSGAESSVVTCDESTHSVYASIAGTPSPRDGKADASSEQQSCQVEFRKVVDAATLADPDALLLTPREVSALVSFMAASAPPRPRSVSCHATPLPLHSTRCQRHS